MVAVNCSPLAWGMSSVPEERYVFPGLILSETDYNDQAMECNPAVHRLRG